MIFTPQQLILSNVKGSISLWEMGRDPEAARDLLAIWANLQRLKPVQDERQDNLNDLVSKDYLQLIRTAKRFDANAWLAEANQLASEWEEGEPNDAPWRTLELFQEVDNHALYLWASWKLRYSNPLDSQLDQAVNFIYSRPDLFLVRFSDIAATLMETRENLQEQESDLFDTLNIHRHIRTFVKLLSHRHVREFVNDPQHPTNPLSL